MYLLGFDVGGTKFAVITASFDGESITIEKRESCPTDLSLPPEKMIEKLIKLAEGILDRSPDSIGISCGGPLDSCRGVIRGPPNLKGWDEVYIVKQISEHFGAPTRLQNDANASAVAEWKFGAAKGAKNAVFMTFGTGLGAGLILDGRLYEGTNGNAGEVGHVRLSDDGPEGYGKRGSFEGFCSGGGIARLATAMAENAMARGITPSYVNGTKISAATVAEAARGGDPTAKEVFRISAQRLGLGISLLIDLFNPEVVVIGSVYARCTDLFYEDAMKVIEDEALSASRSVFRLLPAKLGEQIGDYAAIATALL